MPRRGSTQEITPDTDPAAQDGQEAPEATDAENAEQTDENAGETASTPKRKPTPDTSQVSLDAIKGAIVADPTDPDLGEASEFFAAGAPQRARKPEQEAMDEVAAAAYAKWVAAGRPSQWAKMPVVTFYLDEKDLPAWRHLIRRACLYVTPTDPDTGVRVHFGNEFTLSERMAKKIGREDDTGKTVLMWAAIAKRKVSEDDGRRQVVEANAERKANGDVPERPESEDGNAEE